VILISGLDEADSAQDLGVVGFLVKPIQRADLLAQVRAAIESEAVRT
jgi:hypothetical protein